MHPLKPKFTLPFCALFLILASAAGQGQRYVTPNVSWDPITPEQLALAAPKIDPNAGLEALFHRIHVRDEVMGGQSLQRTLNYYIRLKIFSEKGQEEAATVRIPSSRFGNIVDIAGRTILPDGTILELKGSDIREQQTFSAAGFKQKVKSFALPGVVPGAIVEYRWREIQFEPNTLYIRLNIQQEYPAHSVAFYLLPLDPNVSVYRLRLKWFNWGDAPVTPDPSGFHVIRFADVPAFQAEPMMPGEAAVRAWMLVYYDSGNPEKNPDKYWVNEGKSDYRELREAMRADNRMKAAAAAATQNAATAEEKVIALIRHVRSSVRDLYDDSVTDAERAAFLKKHPKSRRRYASEVYESGIGMPNELNTLFAAMASSVGLEARPVRVGSRDDLSFSKELVDIYFLPNINMAVQLDGQWRIFDVSARLLPAGMLDWREQGIAALLSDSKSPTFLITPLSAPEDTRIVRAARLRLLPDGAIEGSVTAEFTGHEAYRQRRRLEGLTGERLTDEVREQILAQFPGAEVTEIAVEHHDDPESPLKLRYSLRMAGYAQRTGRRLLFQPLIFQRTSTPLFPASERRHVLQFRHAWSEQDTITITWPEGFELDAPENPGGMEFGKPGFYGLKMEATPDRELIVRREFVFGREGLLYYPLQSYPALKRGFDEIHRRDHTSLSLAVKATAGDTR